MQYGNVGKTFGPVDVPMSAAFARQIAAILGISDESVTRRGAVAAGVVPSDERGLFLAMFDDLTDDGSANSSRRLAAGTEYAYESELQLDRTYEARGEILSIEEREGRTGRYQYGTLETTYLDPATARPVMRARIIFAERQGEAHQRARPTPVEPQVDEANELPAWRPPAYTDESILAYVMLVDDRNPNHRDDDYARANGFPSRFASGGMTSTLLGEYVSRHAGSANVAAISFRLTQPIYPGQALEISGRFRRDVDAEGRRLDATLTADGRAVAFAIATLREAISQIPQLG